MDNYFKVDAISQSGLTNFSYGPQYYRSKQTQEFQDSEALKIGSLVDDLLSNTSEEVIKDKYIVANIPKPTGQLGEFTDELAWLYRIDNSIIDCYQLAYDKVGFKRDSLEKVILRFEKEGNDYYQFLINSKGKIVLSQEEYEKAYRVYNSLITNSFTLKYLTLPPNIISKKQLEIYWECLGYPCKAKPDEVQYDVNNGIYHIIDYKTTGFHVNEFPKSFLKFRYDLQAAFYKDAMDYYHENNSELKPYTFGSFTFIVESTKYTGTPVIYRCTEQDLYCGKYGGIGKDGKEYKGYMTLLKELIWHMQHDEWNYAKEVIENNGVIDINGFKEKLSSS